MSEDIRRLLLGLGFDARDGHVRITKGPNFRLLGGSAPTHERMQETCLRFSEMLRSKSLDELFETAGITCPELRNWVEHDQYDDYWRAIDQRLMYEKVRVPGLHGGGWFDHISRGQFEGYAAIRERLDQPAND